MAKTGAARLRKYIDKIKPDVKDKKGSRLTYIHLYGVAQSAAMIARKRSLDPDLAVMAGMLHDIYTYIHGYSPDHGEKGAVLARKILQKLEITSLEETDMICRAIRHHSDKEETHEPFDELLKDADVFQHCIYDPAVPVKEAELGRYHALCEEFGLSL